ncbi:MAG: RnfABCDGE type electron transport complex subunit D [Gammaproteobacteria bacterium]|nr:RnfABCDGE type electron transport complex subunit D [Gammaproteobacteria bacterium]
MPPTVVSSPYLHDGSSVAGMMQDVIVGLLPGVAVMGWYFGWGVPVQLLLAAVTAVAVETLALHLRGLPATRFIADRSALVTAMLLALALPPYVPWWMAPAGVAFALLVAKHAYGGLGCNPFNPAMAGYAFVLLCFPAYFAVWSPGAQASLATIWMAAAGVDGSSGATPLAEVKTGLRLMHMLSEMDVETRTWDWVNGAFLLGGLWLLARRVVTWHVPVAMLAAIAVCAGVSHGVDPDRYPGPAFHLGAGATMLGAFFIATDPVTSPASARGGLLYGALVGGITYVLRVFGAQPDGVAFAVLLANALVPWIDRRTLPRVLGGAP